MKLYAATDKDGNIMIAYPATQFHNEMSMTLKELHTYDPASQVVVDRDVYEDARQIVWSVYEGADCEPEPLSKLFLSAGKEAT